jgi:hypothetical protein
VAEERLFTNISMVIYIVATVGKITAERDDWRRTFQSSDQALCPVPIQNELLKL